MIDVGIKLYGGSNMKNIIIKRAYCAILIFLMCSRLYYNNIQSRHVISTDNSTATNLVSTFQNAEHEKSADNLNDTVPLTIKANTPLTFVTDNETIVISSTQTPLVIGTSHEIIESKTANKNHSQSAEFFLQTSDSKQEYVPTMENANDTHIYINATPIVYNHTPSGRTYHRSSTIRTNDSNVIVGYIMFIAGATLIFLKFTNINKVKKEL